MKAAELRDLASTSRAWERDLTDAVPHAHSAVDGSRGPTNYARCGGTGEGETFLTQKRAG